ncbi:MAG: ornithine cyclodeaminase family protein [Xanthomonadales bacterium]|nr:ornithine cyclodeaminase family protein [Xanthomonadales bacterium]
MNYLSKETLEGLDVSMAEVIASMEHLLDVQARGKAWVAPKTNVSTDDNRFMMATLAVADDPPYMAVKALLVNPANPDRELSTINSSITLLDSRTGLPVTVMDGNWVTALRTAGASALVAKRMANSDSSVLALIGCGVQARSHLWAFAELFPLREVRAYGRGNKNRDALCKLATDQGFKAVASDSARDAVDGADLVVSSIPLVPEIEPFLDASWLKPGVFVSSTDFALPWIPNSLRVFDRIIIDDRQQEAAMAKPMLDPVLISGDIAELVSGSVNGRSDKCERTAFVFRSVALGDLAVAALAYEKTLQSHK